VASIAEILEMLATWLMIRHGNIVGGCANSLVRHL